MMNNVSIDNVSKDNVFIDNVSKDTLSLENIDKPKYRHEMKYLISSHEKQAMINRLGAVMKMDVNGSGAGYTIRSLYFDDYCYSAYEEKMAGTLERRKYRMRIYNFSDKVIKLECKQKQGNYIHKEAAGLKRDEAESILRGEYGFLLKREEKLCKEFYIECMSNRMRPAVIVDYKRAAFVFAQGDVRITFDDHVRSAWLGYDIFDERLPAYEVFEPETLIMEVKYTELLPEFVRRLVLPDNARRMAASKYTLCLEKKWEMTNGG